jgi:O-antigen/teichoic acid export membrane protein
VRVEHLEGAGHPVPQDGHMSDGSEPARSSDHERDESDAERLDRNLAELLQELRVAIIGAQVLFGFLLAIPFTPRFRELGPAHKSLFTADLVLAALATALLVGPVAHHRLRFRRHAKASILRMANAAAIAGLVAVGLAISGSVLLVVSFVWSGGVVWLVTLPTIVAIVGLWFVVPILKDGPDES